jgi:DNA (cytosine-5)-methyltransferase 1
MIRFGSDCSGIDAPFYALKNILGKQYKLKHVFASDIDKYAKQMFLENHKTDIFFDDACIPGEKKPPVDIYFAGFPCQTFSIAGKRAGFDDTRGTVFFYCSDYIKKRKPPLFILENVKGLLSHNKGKTINTIMKTLKSIPGYSVSYGVLSPDSHANWPQHRDRVFIVGRLGIKKPFVFPSQTPLNIKASSLLDKNLPKHSLTPFEKKNLEFKKEKYSKKGIDIMSDYYFIDIGTSPHFGSALYEKSPAMKASRSNYFVTKLHRKLTTDEIRLFQGFPKMKVVVSETQFRKQLGNSVCIPVLIVLFRELLA